MNYAQSIGYSIDIHADMGRGPDELFCRVCRFGNVETAKWLFDYAMSINSPIDIHVGLKGYEKQNYPFIWACREENVKVAQWLLSFGGTGVLTLPKDDPIRQYHRDRFPNSVFVTLCISKALHPRISYKHVKITIGYGNNIIIFCPEL